MLKFDEVLEKVGEFGPYQKRIFILVSMVTLEAALNILSPVFLLDIPKYRCALPGYSNDTYSIQNDLHQELVNITVPLVVNYEGETTYSQCHLYNMTEMRANRTQIECNRWVYDTSDIKSSGITDFDMVCKNEILRSHSNMINAAGGLPGSLLFGILADTIGRKKSLMLSIALSIVTHVAASFAPTYDIYVAISFFTSFAGVGLYMIPFVMVMELVGPSKRIVVGMALNIFWIFGMGLLDIAAYFIRQWRHLRLFIGIFPAIYLLYFWIVPESPRWLITKGKTEEASKTLRKIAESNKMKFDDEVMKNVTVEEEKKTVPVWKMFTNRVLLLRTFIILFNWIVMTLTYSGLTLNIGNLSGNIYLNFLWSILVEAVAYIGCYFLLTRFGRKTILCTSHFFGGVACLASIFPVVYGDATTRWTVVALSMVGRLGTSSAFGVMFIFTAELLPTVVRQSGFALCTLTQILGAMVAPYLSDLGILVKGPLTDALPLIVFGSLSVTVGLLSLLLPETKGALLPETIDDSVNFKTGNKNNTYTLTVLETKPNTKQDKF